MSSLEEITDGLLMYTCTEWRLMMAGVSVRRPLNRIPFMGFSLSLTVRVTHGGSFFTVSVTLEAWKDAPVNKAINVLVCVVLCFCGAHWMVSSFHCWILLCYWDLSLCNHKYLCIDFNLLKPNDIYICRTAALTSRRYIWNIYSTNIHTEYFKHAA